MESSESDAAPGMSVTRLKLVELIVEHTIVRPTQRFLHAYYGVHELQLLSRHGAGRELRSARVRHSVIKDASVLGLRDVSGSFA